MIPAELRDTWPCWYVIAQGLATFTEVTTLMTVEDVINLCTSGTLWPRSTFIRGDK